MPHRSDIYDFILNLYDWLCIKNEKFSDFLAKMGQCFLYIEDVSYQMQKFEQNDILVDIISIYISIYLSIYLSI